MTTTSSYGEMPTSLYRVQPGDDLRSIAVEFYGRGDLWILISLANPGDIHGLRDLRPGKILRIPTLPVE
jgi:nucleoid-associated protein YgaU